MSVAGTSRRDAIVALLDRRGYLSVAETAAHFGVSEMTVRRDFSSLDDRGVARRVSGGLGPALPPGEMPPLAFEERNAHQLVVKRALAAAAADQIRPGSLVGLDAGTTVAPIVDVLPEGCQVVTHSVPVISAVLTRPDLGLIAVGGEYHASTRSFGGPLAGASWRELRLDVAVVSATAIDDRGTWSSVPSDAETKRAMAQAADRVVLLADHSKFAARAGIRALALDQVAQVVTDRVPPDRSAQWPSALRERTLLIDVEAAGNEPPAAPPGADRSMSGRSMGGRS